MNLAARALPGATSRLCQTCTGACARLLDPLPFGQGLMPSGQGLMWTGQPMVCRGGFCVPADAPAELTSACSGDWDSTWEEEVQEEQPEAEEESLGSRRGRRLLVSVSGCV